MLASLVLALLLLALLGGGAWAVFRYGERFTDAGTARLIAGGLVGAGVIGAGLVLYSGLDSGSAARFEAFVERNRGAVSYVFFVEDPQVEHELQIWPLRPPGGNADGPLPLRVILSGPAGNELINQSILVPVAESTVTDERGQSVRAVEWTAWSQNFTPTQPGMYQIALSLPTGAPRVRVRIGEPQAQ